MNREQAPVRVLHIVGSMHPGGMENFIMNLYRAIDRNHVQFDFIVHQSGDADYEREIREMGGKLYTLPRLTAHPVSNLRQVYRIVKDGQYGVVVRHTPNALAAPQIFAALWAGAYAVCHSHNTTDPKKLLHALGKAMMKHARIGRFACSKDAGLWMFGNRKFQVIHNAVDMERFCFSDQKRSLIRTEFSLGSRHVYGHIANFTESKNHVFLMKVYAEIAKLDAKAAFFCIGDGELKESIRQEAEKLGIGNKVLFTGVRHDTDAFLSAMDVLIFPSLFEGLPLTLIEAQAAGLPILLSENVTRDVEVTEGLIDWEPIDEEPERWAHKAVELAAHQWDRACQRDRIAAAGYDIESLAKWYENYFIREASKRENEKHDGKRKR